jgi:RimJ/RimL family protein N-acetyltransferase
MVSKHAYKTPITVARYADEFFDVIMHEAQVQRVQASVHAEDAKAIRFAHWLKFEDEGLMRKYGPDGSDYHRMARVS